MNPKSEPVKSNSEQYQFFLSTFPAKIKNPFLMVILAQRECFLKTLAKYSCGGPPAFKRQRYRVEQNIIPSRPKWFNQSAQFIKSFVRYTWFKNPTIFKASPIFDHTHPIIIKVTFSFHKFVLAGKKSAQFINLFLIQQILESRDLKDGSHFCHQHPKITKVTFRFPEFLSIHKKPI